MFEDIIDIFYNIYPFVLLWVQPIWWMFFFHNKRTDLDKYFSKFAIGLALLGSVLYLIPITRAFVFSTKPVVSLMVFYTTIGLVFTHILMFRYKWHLPQAMSMSALIVFIGSFYWESPYLIRNAFLLGPELDWVLHITGLMFFWYIKDTVGWKKDPITLVLVVFGFFMATVFMKFGPLPSPDPTKAYIVWNSPYYLSDRLICTVIAFFAIKKKVPIVGLKRLKK